MTEDRSEQSARDYPHRNQRRTVEEGSKSQRHHRDPEDEQQQQRSDPDRHHQKSRRRRHRGDDDEEQEDKILGDDREVQKRRRHRRRSPSRSVSPSSSSSSSTQTPTIHPRLASAGLPPLTQQDYYSHSAPFRHWLLHSRKPKRLNDLSSSDSHSLFRRFIDKYNFGELPDLYYSKDDSITAASLVTAPAGQTGYKWGFLAKRSIKEQEEVDLLRDGVDSLTNGTSKGAKDRRQREMKGRRTSGEMADDGGEEIGPSLPPPTPSSVPVYGTAVFRPTAADARFAGEEAAESSLRESKAQRRAERRDAKDVREELQPRATGRDAVIERRRETNKANREFEAARGAAEIELPEEQLMGGDASYQEALAAQQRSRSRSRLGGGQPQAHPRSKAQETRDAKRLEREEDLGRRREAFKAKEDGTMAMLRELAKSRFGG